VLDAGEPPGSTARVELRTGGGGGHPPMIARRC
jgi:hypothetical protein